MHSFTNVVMLVWVRFLLTLSHSRSWSRKLAGNPCSLNWFELENLAFYRPYWANKKSKWFNSTLAKISSSVRLFFVFCYLLCSPTKTYKILFVRLFICSIFLCALIMQWTQWTRNLTISSLNSDEIIMLARISIEWMRKSYLCSEKREREREKWSRERGHEHILVFVQTAGKFLRRIKMIHNIKPISFFFSVAMKSIWNKFHSLFQSLYIFLS